MNVTGEAVTNRWIKPLEHIPHDVWESDPKKTGAKVAKQWQTLLAAKHQCPLEVSARKPTVVDVKASTSPEIC